MRQNNKGYSLVELIIVIAIMVILAGLSTVTFQMANSRRPEKVRNNLKTYGDYAKTLVSAENKDSCIALIKATDNNYYLVPGIAAGTSMADLRANFKAKEVGSGADLDIDALKADPKKGKDAHSLGKGVEILYSDDPRAASISAKHVGTSNCPSVVIKYKKFDGSVIGGGGIYYFTKYRAKGSSTDVYNNIKTSIVLEPSTGAFHKKN